MGDRVGGNRAGRQAPGGSGEGEAHRGGDRAGRPQDHGRAEGEARSRCRAEEHAFAETQGTAGRHESRHGQRNHHQRPGAAQYAHCCGHAVPYPKPRAALDLPGEPVGRIIARLPRARLARCDNPRRRPRLNGVSRRGIAAGRSRALVFGTEDGGMLDTATAGNLARRIPVAWSELRGSVAGHRQAGSRPLRSRGRADRRRQRHVIGPHRTRTPRGVVIVNSGRQLAASRTTSRPARPGAGPRRDGRGRPRAGRYFTLATPSAKIGPVVLHADHGPAVALAVSISSWLKVPIWLSGRPSAGP